MRINANDLTLKRNYLEKYRFMIKKYELVKSKQHPIYKLVNDFIRLMIPIGEAF
jgi:hypothetical protein